MSAGEILEQVRVAAKAMHDGEVAGGLGRLSNIVFMGMGEPMGNYNSVLSAVRQISAMPPEGFGISARNITVSTVGVVPGIKKLTAEVTALTATIHQLERIIQVTVPAINSKAPANQSRGCSLNVIMAMAASR